MTGAAAVEVDGLRVGYGHHGFTLSVPRFTLAPGEAVALVGPSGCGKTTFLHTLAGILAPEVGSVRVEGTPVHGPGAMGEAAARRFRLTRLGLVFQELELLEHVSVRDNLLLPWHLGAKPCPWAEALSRAQVLAESLGIAPHLQKKPRALSQGERQRVAVGRALAPHPSIVFADEPTGNLDAVSARRVLDLLLAGVKERGAALLLVTHDPALLPRLSRVVELPALAKGAA